MRTPQMDYTSKAKYTSAFSLNLIISLQSGVDWDNISCWEISLIQAIPYTHNKKHGQPY